MKHDLVTTGIIIIGNEVLSAKVRDANGPFLINRLHSLGIHVAELRIIPDDENIIAQCVRQFAAQFDHVFTSGGVGPTHDDITIKGVSRGLGLPIVRHPELEAKARTYWGADVTPAQLRMAYVPDGTVVTLNRCGFPVLQVMNIVMLPGVPSFLQACFETVAPSLKRGPKMHSRQITVFANETDIADSLGELQTNFPAVSIGSYPNFDSEKNHVLITLDGLDPDQVQNALAMLKKQVLSEYL